MRSAGKNHVLSDNNGDNFNKQNQHDASGERDEDDSGSDDSSGEEGKSEDSE